MATILLHNMMVNERVADDEVKDGSFYNTISNENDEDNDDETDLDNDAYSSTPAGRQEKFGMVHRRWAELYDYEGSKCLKDSMKRHLFCSKFGRTRQEKAHLWMDNFNPLNF